VAMHFVFVLGVHSGGHVMFLLSLPITVVMSCCYCRWQFAV